jgi:plastocyanin
MKLTAYEEASRLFRLQTRSEDAMTATSSNRRHHSPPAVLWLCALALVLAACGPAATEATPTPMATPTPDANDGATPAPPDNGDETVELVGFAFAPSELTISAGTSVTFVNEDAAPHTATHGSGGAAADDPLFDERLGGGDAATVTFDEPGTYEVTCTLHPTMNMTITVTD